MRIIVNHLTRMQPGYICVAGVDAKTNEHIRPVLPGARLPVSLLRKNGGVFDIAAVVELGDTQPRGTPPETEDRGVDQNRLVSVKSMDPATFWSLLGAVSRRTLREIFGRELKPQRNGCAVDEGKGQTSLGCIRLPEPPEVFINPWGRIRMKVSDGIFDVDLSVTDLRLYESDQKTPRARLVASLQRRIETGVGLILSVGLARAFRVKDDTARRHWLQVNNIHLEDDPVWKGA